MNEDRSQLIDNIRLAIENCQSKNEILQSAVELIDNFSEAYSWTGFYMLGDGALHVGPYIGPKTEHTKIELNNGICGAAASSKRTVMVDDVLSDPRFIACSISTRSEIVVPLMNGDECIGEIDIDSNVPACFTDADRKMLEEIAEIIVDRLKKVSAL